MNNNSLTWRNLDNYCNLVTENNMIINSLYPSSISIKLPSSIQKIIKKIREHRNKMTPQLAQKILIDADVKMEELKAWEDYDHPFIDSYGRKLLFADSFFEIMVMSWSPGDISAIHDHGHAQWGAVQIFGAAEHATFLVQDNSLVTISRQVMKPGKVLPVGHQLIHQMGNQTENKFLTLHVYGFYDIEHNFDSVTGNARIFNITEGIIQRTNGGVFFGLPDDKINAVELGPVPDYMSWLRNTTEYIRRIRKASQQSSQRRFTKIEQNLTEQIFDMTHWQSFESELKAYVDSNGYVTSFHDWKLLRNELIQAAHLQAELLGMGNNKKDSFCTFAAIYDEVMGKQCLNEFTSNCIQFVHNIYNLDFTSSNILSIGCGTGIMEEYILNTYDLRRENLLGIDTSESMVKVALKRINAVVKDILNMEAEDRLWDIIFASVNVFQYLPYELMIKAIEKTFKITNSGGYFIGDFITPDHIRAYPHVVFSENVISLREPLLIEQTHNLIQQSEIINVSKLHGQLHITYEGKHIYYLPSLWKMRYIFEKFFKRVDIFDALTLEPLKPEDDTSPSTRYLLVAQK
jgi:SAM-dependent methyltransferase/predicted metal-dependent enzyme (double-stranded beta helix superfamily)